MKVQGLRYHVNPLYHLALTREQKQAIADFCEGLEESTRVVLIEGLLRLVLRMMCGNSAQTKPSEDLMVLLMYCPETFEAFFGIEHVQLYNNMVDESKFDDIAYVGLQYGQTAELCYAMHEI